MHNRNDVQDFNWLKQRITSFRKRSQKLVGGAGGGGVTDKTLFTVQKIKHFQGPPFCYPQNLGHPQPTSWPQTNTGAESRSQKSEWSKLRQKQKNASKEDNYLKGNAKKRQGKRQLSHWYMAQPSRRSRTKCSLARVKALNKYTLNKHCFCFLLGPL